MKKNFLMLSCIAAIVTATVVGKKTFESHADETNDLLMQNVEALAENAEEPYPEERTKCINEGGMWNMASKCTASGFERPTCKVSGELSVWGITIKGSYEKGKKYAIPWARYECVDSSGNCCKKQGLYSGETKLA